MVFQRGYYTHLTCAAWDWRNGKLSQRWYADSRKGSGFSKLRGQGNHSIMAADADNDGKDEIFFGSSALNNDGLVFWTNGMGHGDANHMGDLDPSHPGMELWLVRESATSGNYGSYMADALTGNPMWGVKVSKKEDVGRGCAADIDASSPGYEMWSTRTGGIFSCRGSKLHSSVPSINFRVYWDGDLQDELLDGNSITYSENGSVRLKGNSCNGTKKTPNLSADILGDWREEVILHDGASKLYLHTTTIVTKHRLYTLMHDPAYRAQVSSEQSAYNQPPHLSFYLGNGTDKAPKPDMYVIGTGHTHIQPIVKTTLGTKRTIQKIISGQSLTISTSTKGKTDIAIYDLSGHIVKKTTLKNGIIRVKDLGIAEGVYIVKTITENINIINR
jgi:rhamnogalacturonan endolyase